MKPTTFDARIIEATTGLIPNATKEVPNKAKDQSFENETVRQNFQVILKVNFDF